VYLGHMTAEGLCLFERSLLADWADEDIAFLDRPELGFCVHQAFGGARVSLLLDLLGGEPFHWLHQDVKVEVCLLLLNLFFDWLRMSLALRGLHADWRLDSHLLRETFILFDS
jgi:hypothetical protein